MKRVFALIMFVFVLLSLAAVTAESNRAIRFKSEEYVVYIGKNQQIKATVERISEDAPRQTQLLWKSSDESVAKVSANGTVNGVSAGIVTITAYAKDDETVAGSVQVEIRTPVKNITLDTREAKLLIGGADELAKLYLNYEVVPEDAYHQDVEWSSSNEKVAIVDENGVVTALSKGNATITATSIDPSAVKKTNCQIKVDQLVTGIELEKADVLVPVNKTVRVKATALPADASNKGLIWASSDESIAKVSQDGTVRGVTKGETTVTAKAKDAGGFETVIKVTVVSPVSKITPSEKKITLPVGLTQTVTAFVEPEDADVRDVIWSSSNERVATVDQNGVITGVGAGTANIIATAVDGSNVKGQVSVTIKKYDVVLKMSEKNVKVNFDTTGGINGAYIQIGRYVMGDFDETTVTIKNGCVEGVDYQKLNPVKPGEDSITVTVKHNGRRVTSRKTYSVFVYDDSVGEPETTVSE